MCLKCGRLVEDDEVPVSYQTHGFTSIGDEYREKIDGQCSCGGYFAEAHRCEVCFNWFASYDGEKPKNMVCDICVEEQQTVANAIEIGMDDERKVSLNGFVVDALGEEKINEILIEWAKQNIKDTDIRVFSYCRGDLPSFEEFVMAKNGVY
jgi:hypothetical protein